MKAYNITEFIVCEEVDHFMSGEEYKGCRCARCRADIMALALNQLPAKYVVTEKGEVISKLESSILQKQIDILAAVVTAGKIVSSSPRHKNI